MGLPTAFSSKTKLWFRSKFPYESSFALLQLRHWLFCFDGGFKVQILHDTESLCMLQCNICRVICLIIASFVLLAKTKALGVNLHNHLASITWRFNYFANSILAPKHRGVVPYEHIHHTQCVRLFVVRFPLVYFTISQHCFTILHIVLQELIHNSRELGEKLYCPVVLGGPEKVRKGVQKGCIFAHSCTPYSVL